MTSPWPTDVLLTGPIYKLGLADVDPEVPAANVFLDLPLEVSDLTLARGEYTGPRPRATLFEPGPFRDLVRTASTAPFLVSGHFRDALVSNKLSGWATLDVDMSDLHKAEDGDYKILVISGRCGSISKTPDGLGIMFDPRAWDGSDLFMLDGYGGILLTSRAAHALEAAHLGNLVIEEMIALERMQTG